MTVDPEAVTPEAVQIVDTPVPLAGRTLGVAGRNLNLVQLEDEKVPLAVLTDEEEELPEAVTVDETEGEAESEEEQTLTDIVDEEVPLTGNLVEDMKHCILHFFEWILAAILSGYYVVSTKKQKKEIAELRNEFGQDDKK